MPTLNYPFITKFEKSKIIGIRANMIERGAKIFVDIPEDRLFSAYKIALLEYEQNKIPFVIKRNLPNNKYEYLVLQEVNSKKE